MTSPFWDNNSQYTLSFAFDLSFLALSLSVPLPHSLFLFLSLSLSVSVYHLPSHLSVLCCPSLAPALFYELLYVHIFSQIEMLALAYVSTRVSGEMIGVSSSLLPLVLSSLKFMSPFRLLLWHFTSNSYPLG
jgi:hypothetical protein